MKMSRNRNRSICKKRHDKLVPSEQDRFFYKGVLYRPGVTLEHLQRAGKETDLIIVVEDLLVMMNDRLPHEKRLTKRRLERKAQTIFWEILSKYFNDDITKSNYHNSPKVLEMLHKN